MTLSDGQVLTRHLLASFLMAPLLKTIHFHGMPVLLILTVQMMLYLAGPMLYTGLMIVSICYTDCNKNCINILYCIHIIIMCCLIQLIHYIWFLFIANTTTPSLDILPYIAFNKSISAVTIRTGENHLSNSWKVNAPRPIPLLGFTYSSIYVSDQ